MKTFVDNAGRTWTVAINVDAIKRVRDLAKVNLLEVVEGKLLERLISDPVLLCDVIYCVCKPEAETKGLSDADFGRAMAGDAIDGATTALLEELVDFFPQGKRRVLSKALAKLRKLETAALAAVETRLDSPELERRMATQLAELENAPAAAPPAIVAWELIWQCAGILALHPGRLTLRQLVEMAQARQAERWNHTAAILAMLANVNRDPKKGRALKPADFHPLLKSKSHADASPPLKGDIRMLKTLFIDRRL